MNRISTENPVMALVVDRSSRKVIDVERIEASYKITDVFERHDLKRVEIIFRAPESTVITEHEAEPFIRSPAVEASPSAELNESDVPF